MDAILENMCYLGIFTLQKMHFAKFVNLQYFYKSKKYQNLINTDFQT